MVLYITYLDYTNNESLTGVLQDYPIVIYLGLFLSFVAYSLIFTCYLVDSFFTLDRF